MTPMRFRRTSSWSVASAALVTLALAACNYSFRQGAGFPADVRTVYIAAFENQTVQLDIDSELFRELSERVPRALGVRPAGENAADAVVRGRVVRYDDTQLTRPGQPGSIEVLQNQVQITVAIQIVDVRRNEILWESSSVTGRGEYRADTQNEDVGRRAAIQSIVTQIIDGAQSQW
jgi:curli biogenesis system outer membrane secretion channel CsgG